MCDDVLAGILSGVGVFAILFFLVHGVIKLFKFTTSIMMDKVYDKVERNFVKDGYFHSYMNEYRNLIQEFTTRLEKLEPKDKKDAEKEQI